MSFHGFERSLSALCSMTSYSRIPMLWQLLHYDFSLARISFKNWCCMHYGYIDVTAVFSWNNRSLLMLDFHSFCFLTMLLKGDNEILSTQKFHIYCRSAIVFSGFSLTIQFALWSREKTMGIVLPSPYGFRKGFQYWPQYMYDQWVWLNPYCFLFSFLSLWRGRKKEKKKTTCI